MIDRAPDRRHLAAIAIACLALLVVACGSGTGSTTGPTPVNVAEMSLPPADEAITPAPVATSETLPSEGPPTGVPEPPEVSVDYTLGADDPAGFRQAYRSAFEGIDLDDAAVDAAGARLCSYLMRRADAAGTVALEDVLMEANLNEPGFSREAWVAAFEVATAHYCGEFEVVE